MWFLRRRRRRPPLDLSSLERSLERLAELVERIIGLIPELAAARPDNPSRPPVEPAPDSTPESAPKPPLELAPEPAPEAAPEPAPEAAPEPAPEPPPEQGLDGHVLFAGGPNGYRLLERGGEAPPRGTVVELDHEQYVVLRLGPSPLPADRRRCAFLEPRR